MSGVKYLAKPSKQNKMSMDKQIRIGQSHIKMMGIFTNPNDVFYDFY